MKAAFALLALALPGATGPHKVVRQSATLDFKYEWPAEAAAIPALDLRFYREAKYELTQAQKEAPEDQEEHEKMGLGSAPEGYFTRWTATGQSSRLLSLREDFEEPGGAHPNYNTSDLLWDRQRGREIKFHDLFARSGGYAPIVRSAYCQRLANMKVKRTGDPIEKEFWSCPKFSELALLPTDSDKNGRFDEINFVASPYTAGSFAEGEYEVILPVTVKLIAALKPEYRASFEAHRQ
jgi:hypothetical protein